jgi:hypothetical protein
MDKREFEKKIGLYAKEWIIDANQPIKGTYVKKSLRNNEEMKPRVRAKKKPSEINTTGPIQIITWQKRREFCVQCCRSVEDRRELIHLPDGCVKCSCGLKYSNKLTKNTEDV